MEDGDETKPAKNEVTQTRMRQRGDKRGSTAKFYCTRDAVKAEMSTYTQGNRRNGPLKKWGRKNCNAASRQGDVGKTQLQVGRRDTEAESSKGSHGRERPTGGRYKK